MEPTDMKAIEWITLGLAVAIGNAILWAYILEPIKRNKHLKAKIPKKKGPE